MPLHNTSTIALFFALLLVGGCASQPLFIVDHDPEFDFRRYRTYAWYDDLHKTQLAEYRQYNSSDKRVRTYVDRELTQKGFREVSSGNPDFLVNYSISRQEHMKVDSFAGYPSAGMYGGVGAGTMGSGVSVGYSSGPSVRTYKEGTVVLDVIDTPSNRIVWRSLAEGRLAKSLSHSEKDSRASKLAREMMTDFPPGESAHPVGSTVMP
jgi:hypothetical protein